MQFRELGGRQQRHHDRYDYMREKPTALKKWERQLDQIAAGKRAAVISPNFKREVGGSH